MVKERNRKRHNPFAEEEKISADELREILSIIENKK